MKHLFLTLLVFIALSCEVDFKHVKAQTREEVLNTPDVTHINGSDLTQYDFYINQMTYRVFIVDYGDNVNYVRTGRGVAVVNITKDELEVEKLRLEIEKLKLKTGINLQTKSQIK